MRRQHSTAGLALIELASLCVVALPIMLGVVSLVDYLQLRYRLDDLVSRAAMSSRAPAFYLTTGNQGWFLRAATSCGGADTSSIRDELTQIRNDLAESIELLLRCEDDCETRYYLELRTVFVRINTSTGALVRDSGNSAQSALVNADCERRLEREGKGLVAFAGSLRRGAAAGRSESPLFSQLLQQLDSDPGQPSLFAVPGGLYGANQQQVYGFSEARAVSPTDDSLATPINFLRMSAVFGIYVEVSLEHTLAAPIARLAPAADDAIPTLKAYRVSVPRSEL